MNKFDITLQWEREREREREEVRERFKDVERERSFGRLITPHN